MPNKIERMGIKGYWTKPSIDTKGAFGSCKMFSGKYIFSGNANFQKRKMYSDCLAVSEIIFRKINSGVWFVQTFYGNRFTENQFRCLVRPNILRKSFYWKSFPVFGLWIILRKIWNVLQIQAPALSRQTCNSTKLIIHFNIKNNHSNWGTWIA